MPANNKAAAFITKDGKVTVHLFLASLGDIKSIRLPLVLEEITEPIKMQNIGEVLFIKTTEKTPCPCCGILLQTFREQ
jgi:hypothetical protein